MRLFLAFLNVPAANETKTLYSSSPTAWIKQHTCSMKTEEMQTNNTNEIYKKNSTLSFFLFLATLRGLNFAGIKFRGFRGFRKNREIKSRRKICNGPSAKLNPHKFFCKIRVIREILFYFFKQTYIQSLFDTKHRPWLISQT